MSKFGKYDPAEVEHGSALFSYGEVPVASSKLNTWNGNIEASLNWAVRCVAILLGGRADDFVLNEDTGEELKVRAQSPPALSVQVKPGKAIVAQFFAGLDATETLPATGSIPPPTSQPRYDRVYLDRQGALGIEQGSEWAPPSPPSTPVETVSLALLYLRPGMTSIKDTDDGSNGYVVDDRPALLNGKAHRPNGDAAPLETPDGSRTQFSTADGFVAGSLDVYVNGLLQAKSGVYAEDSDGRGYTFSSPPPSGYQIQHRYLVESD